MYGALTLVLVVAVVAIAYGSTAPSLAVAEFSPSAQRALDAPPTTSGPNTAVQGGSSRGPRRSTTTTAAPSSTAPAGRDSAAVTTRVGRSRACFGDPPRQLEDPLSPPCAATIFEGDNGGATGTGVSATEIRVGVPNGDVLGKVLPALFDFFNRRFELYGRRLVPVVVPGSVATAEQARAHAAALTAEHIFAAITAARDWDQPQAALPLALAREGVITVAENIGTWWTDRTLFDPNHPYVWSVFPSAEDLQANVADFACRSLAGHVARHAGNPNLHNLTRRFAVVAAGFQTAPSPATAVRAIEECTGQPVLRADWTVPSGTPALRTSLTRLRDAGATTVVCICESWAAFDYVAGQAGAAPFAPEWIITPTTWRGNNDDEAAVQNYRRGSALPPPIRLSPGPRLVPLQSRPWFQALVAADASLSSYDFDVWARAGYVYDQLLVLASGIQAAGPQLTADTFAQGLMGTQFPNPGAGQSPYWQPSAGFGPGDHSFYDDYTVAWWSDAAEALNHPASANPQGSWCYLQQGARFRPGSYPTDADAQLFNPGLSCR